MLRWFLAGLCLLCAGLCNGVMDSLQFHFSQTMFADASRFDPQFWNPAESWKNKYLDYDASKGEAFFGSSTFLVFTTDAWHLFKFFMLKFFVLAALSFAFGPRWYWDELADWVKVGIGMVGLTLCYQCGFWVSYV